MPVLPSAVRQMQTEKLMFAIWPFTSLSKDEIRYCLLNDGRRVQNDTKGFCLNQSFQANLPRSPLSHAHVFASWHAFPSSLHISPPFSFTIFILVHSVVKFSYAYLLHETNSDRKRSSSVWYSLIKCGFCSPVQTAQIMCTYRLVDFEFFTTKKVRKFEMIEKYLKYDLAGLKLMNME
jgi:hypothetical protein